jgi:ElaB/YqjD/DUF883 family membrane-anchored ribosome-binding protein
MGVQDRARDFSDKAQGAAKDAAQDTSRLVAQAVAALQALAAELSSRTGAIDPAEAVAAIKGAGKAATDNLGALAQGAGEAGKAQLDDLGVAVRRNPLTWLAVAAGIGLIFGLWQGRESTR